MAAKKIQHGRRNRIFSEISWSIFELFQLSKTDD